MPQIHTHYDNLKVSRNAPQEVIRAAYKVLSQKYHPDKNQNKVDATRVMALINESYSVLSDEEKRFEHDQWIIYQENLNAQQSANANNQTEQKEFETTSPTQPPLKKANENTFALHFIKNWYSYIFLAVILGIWFWNSSNDQSAYVSSNPYQATLPQVDASKNAKYELGVNQIPAAINQVAVKKPYERPILAPNNSPWPQVAGYVKGYPLQLSSGLSTVTVDNSQNDAEVFVKLVSLDGAQLFPARQFYIPAFGTFKLNDVNAGKYDVRYRDLSNGHLSRSEAFVLREEATETGTRYSNITMTLYKIKNGNMQTYGLPETDF